MAALAGAGVGGAVGGIAGALIGMGIPEYEAKSYDQAVPNPTSMNPKRSKYQQKNDFIFKSS